MKETIRSQVKSIWKVIAFTITLSFTSSPFYFIIRILINLISVALPMITIYISSAIVNVLAEGYASPGSEDTLFRSFVLFIFFLFTMNILSRAMQNLQTHCMGMQREIMGKHIKDLFMKKTSSLDLSFFDSSSFYNSLSDANMNSTLITYTAFDVMDLIKYLAQWLLALFYMSRYSLLFAALLTLSIIPQVLFQKKQFELTYNLQLKFMGNERKLNYINHIATSRAFVKDVKLYNLFPFLIEKFSAIWNTIFVEKRKLSKKYTFLLILSNFLPELVTAAVTFRLGYGVIHKQFPLGTYTYYQGVAGQVLSCMYMVVSSYGRLMDGKNRIQNVIKFLNWENKLRDEGTAEAEGNAFTIEFQNVSFRYAPDMPMILHNVSFTIHSSEKVALVGVNGSGKTTLVKLLLRFYDPDEGVILLNGLDIRQYRIESLRKCFSTMFQDYCNYAFSVRESVSLSGYKHSDDTRRVEEALGHSGAVSFVTKFPNGIETYLTREYEENGEELSGGQWQKMALSRAFFRDAPLYILDEPSASLDAESEDELFRRFETLYADKGAVLVSHRLSNITHVDQILVLDGGHVVENGTHGELMKLNGKYARLYTLQANKYRLTDE